VEVRTPVPNKITPTKATGLLPNNTRECVFIVDRWLT